MTDRKMTVVDLGKMDYDGSQLKHCLAYEYKKVLGSTISYFIGAAAVKEHLVDLEDSLANDFIKSKKMAHFVIEIPGASITEAVLWQRLFITKCIDWIHANRSIRDIMWFNRDGDDILIALVEGDWKKLSVSIATLSRFSGLIHVGINIEVGPDCPVKAIGLSEITSNISQFAKIVAKEFAEEYTDIVNATYKVVER